MAARLGNVLYWLGCAGAVIGLALAAIVFFNPGEYAAIWWPRYLGAGLLSGLAGRIARNVLAGR